MINFNPNLRKNDSLSPEQITARADQRNAETRELVEKAYLASDVPITAAERAANHSSITRQTPEAQKARKDASFWAKAKNYLEGHDDD
jgi:hypothetical protein